jgi:TPR repeat protein
MASSPIINPPLFTLLEWYKIRDTFFGLNCVVRNTSLALEMAATSSHPDARWLTEACAGKDVRTEADAKRVFFPLGQNDARALCFAWLLGDQNDLAPLHRSVELGFAFAQALMAWKSQGKERFKFAQLAAMQGERLGIHWVGLCFRDGEGCDMDLVKAKEKFLHSSELGVVSAMERLGFFVDESDPQRWRWWGRAAALGRPSIFLNMFAKKVKVSNYGSRSEAVLFAIGQALYGRVNEEKRRIFNDDYKFDSRFGFAKIAITFYGTQIKATKDAMRAWTQVGIKLKVVKDVRKLIAKLIWDSREEALYGMFEGCEQEELKLEQSHLQKIARK